MTPPGAVLVASPDDFLLEEARRAVVEELLAAMPGAEVEAVPEGTGAADLALMLRSPSLFVAERILWVPDAQRWLAGRGRGRSATGPAEDPGPLVEVLEAGLPEGTALVLAAEVRGRPSGVLVDALERGGRVQWIALPEPPKPWEEAGLSADQVRVLRGVLRRAARGAVFERKAEQLLLDRMGFAPRQLAQEAQKLAAAAGGGTVTEELVLRLTFPPEMSLDMVLDALEAGAPGRLLELVDAAERGVPVRDWRGRRLVGGELALPLAGNLARHLEQMLYLRLLAMENGMEAELDPRRTGERSWYGSRFKGRLGPRLMELIAGDPGSPFVRRDGKPGKLSPWHLHRLFRAAGRFPEEVLRRALVAVGDVERATRGPAALEAVAAFLMELEAGLGRPV